MHRYQEATGRGTSAPQRRGASGGPYFFPVLHAGPAQGAAATLAAGTCSGGLGRSRCPRRMRVVARGRMVASVLGHVFSPWLKFKVGRAWRRRWGRCWGVFPVLTWRVPVAVVWVIVFLVKRTSAGVDGGGAMLPMVVLEFEARSTLG